MNSNKHNVPTGQTMSKAASRLQIFGRSKIPSRLAGCVHGRQEGGALVEFALVAPMMLALLTGIFGLGFALTDYLQLNNAVDIGARTIAVIRATNSDGTTPDPCAAATTAIKNSAPALNGSQIQLSFNLNGTPYSNVTTCTNGSANIIAGKTAQVSATYPYTLMLFGWKPVSMTLSAQTTELLQ